ncbi:MAG: spore germination protein [Candidatus Saccharibacteria bacterium]
MREEVLSALPGLIQSLTNLLSYKPPQNSERGFELLEGTTEGSSYTEVSPSAYEDQNQTAYEQTPVKKKKYSRVPLQVGQWNEKKQIESLCEPTKSATIVTELCVNLATIKQRFRIPANKDVILREFKIGRKLDAFMVYFDGMIDKQILHLAILPQLMAKDCLDDLGDELVTDYLSSNILSVFKLEKMDSFALIIQAVLMGASALFVEGCNEAIVFDTRGYEKRNVEQPVTETVVHGPQEAFTENMRTNISLVRRIIRNENLVTEMLPVGKMNNSMCAIMYIEGVANPQVVQEVKKRIKRIDTDFMLGDGMLEQFIEDNSFMLFPQVLSTERPDRTASFLVEGQVVMFGEGTPFALTVPVTFFRLFHASEDTFVRWPAGIFLRLIRLIGLFCATLLPGIYVAMTLFHPEMIPTELLTSMANSKEIVPFPTVLEVLLMEFAFELIREAGTRVPSVIGQTLGIVGALILGQAAVAAGLVSPVLVIVVAFTGLGNFAIPNYTLGLAIRIERFLFIITGAAFGILGVSLTILLLAFLACSMKSFGVPYFTPLAPRTAVNPDVVIRNQIWTQKNRPDAHQSPNRKRQGDNVKVWMNEKNSDQNGGGKQT